MHSAGTQMPERTAYTAAPSASVSASAPSGPSSKLAKLTEEDQLELSERDLWEDDAGIGLCFLRPFCDPSANYVSCSELAVCLTVSICFAYCCC